MRKLRWGVLSTAKIARCHFVPAIQTSALSEVVAIASRNQITADTMAQALNIPRAYADYDELLADPEIDAIYNPLPNHLHVPWSIKAIQAGKHLLCEKPLGLNSADVSKLLDVAAQHPQIKVMEAFMYRFHPQWQRTLQLVREGRIGQVRHIHSHFAYNNHDTHNIRHQPEMGGGALMDIGCYCISLARFLLNEEPTAVLGQITPYAHYTVDCLVSGLMEFSNSNASFTASTKTEAEQYVQVHGEKGSIYIPVPFNPIGDAVTQITLNTNNTREDIVLQASNHYRNLSDAFAHSIQHNTAVPTPLSDAAANMKIIDAIFASAHQKQWVSTC
jgi:predicted dehydrogenase